MGIRGKKGLGNTSDESEKVQASLLKTEYEHHTVVVGAPIVDESLATLSPGAFGEVERAHTIIIRVSGGDISFRFNSLADASIPLSAAEGAFTSNTLEIDAVFFTAPAGTTIKVFLV